MNRSLLVLSFLLFNLSHSFSQEKPAAYAVADTYNLWNLQEEATAYIFADNAYIRDYPGLDGALLDSIQHGTAVKIISPAYNGNSIRGFQAPWHKVSYTKNGQTKTGFIWLGLLALGKQNDKDGNLYLYGFDRRITPAADDSIPYYNCVIKLLNKNNELTAKYAFAYEDFGQTYTSSKLLPSMGLDGITAIFRVEFIGEACGIPSKYYYAARNGEAFFRLPDRQSVSDAGVYYYDEQILFPSEHKKEKNRIYKIIEEGEAIDDEADEIKYTKTNKEEKYIWDGRSITQLIELK